MEKDNTAGSYMARDTPERRCWLRHELQDIATDDCIEWQSELELRRVTDKKRDICPAGVLRASGRGLYCDGGEVRPNDLTAAPDKVGGKYRDIACTTSDV